MQNDDLTVEDVVDDLSQTYPDVSPAYLSALTNRIQTLLNNEKWKRDRSEVGVPASQLTKREAACLFLRVPATGNKVLDGMIITRQKIDVASYILSGVMSKTFDNKREEVTETILDVMEYTDALIHEVITRRKKAAETPQQHDANDSRI